MLKWRPQARSASDQKSQSSFYTPKITNKIKNQPKSIWSFSIRSLLIDYLITTFRPFPFRLQNENTCEALSLWHLTSPPSSVRLDIEETEDESRSDRLWQVKPLCQPATDNQRSFVLRRHAHTGPLHPLRLVAPAISNIVCLFTCWHFF